MEEKVMARGPRYCVPYRRRREGKTDYQLRRALVISGLPRLVTRGTLKHVIVQIVKAKAKGDEVVASAHSRELTKTFGWKGYCGNVPVAYLTGLLCGFRAVANGVKKAILDIGLQSPTRSSRSFAVLRGALDAGVSVAHDKEILPDEKRIQGQHIVDYANELSSNPEVYQYRFSKYLSKGLRPEQIAEHFASTKEKILSSFKIEVKKS
jgi:large subunit ribosomal protein L18